MKDSTGTEGAETALKTEGEEKSETTHPETPEQCPPEGDTMNTQETDQEARITGTHRETTDNKSDQEAERTIIAHPLGRDTHKMTGTEITLQLKLKPPTIASSVVPPLVQKLLVSTE